MFSSSGFLFAAAPGLLAGLWSLGLVLVLGCASIYLLLPRPRPYLTLWGASLGTLALVAAGIVIVNNGTLSIESLLFYAFSGMAIVAGTLLVSQHNPARAALAFTLVVLNTGGLFLLLAAPFLMAASIIIYAGAIVVTFLFVIMLAQQTGFSSADQRSREPLFSAIAGFAFLGAVLFLLEGQYGTSALNHYIQQIRWARDQDSSVAIANIVGKDEELFRQFQEYLEKHLPEDPRGDDLKGQVFNLRQKWPLSTEGTEKEMKEILDKLLEISLQVPQARLGIIHLRGDLSGNVSTLSGPSPMTPPREIRRDSTGVPLLPAENATYLGRSLFTDYLLPVELGGFLLLVAVVGAIAIAQRGGQEKKSS